MKLITSRLSTTHNVLALVLIGSLSGLSAAHAGMTYSLQQTHAVAGETVNIAGLLLNDSSSALDWSPRQNLVLQWRDTNGHIIRSLAYLESPAAQTNLPVNSFAKFSWRAVVPSEARGLQAISIEGEPVLLALDTSPLERSMIAGTPAVGPVVDAGAALGTSQRKDPPLPDSVVVAAGAQVAQGPAVNQTTPTSTSNAPFDRFRNAISPYEPTYFILGNQDGLDARYQVSFKYRLFTPKDPMNPDFVDNFYLGYTQTALWDLDSDSKPFVDTSYRPSIFWRKDALWQAPGKQLYLGLASGVEHESNGKSGADSRSLNQYYLQPEFNYRFDGGSVLTFAPRIKGYFGKSSNPDYPDYAGYVDWKLRWAQDNGLVLSGLYRQGQQGRNTSQIDAAWPLSRTFLNMNGFLHVQYFRGYGETLLGYQHKSGSQVRVGLSLIP
jgi:outer membrane phospholipase A